MQFICRSMPTFLMYTSNIPAECGFLTCALSWWDWRRGWRPCQRRRGEMCSNICGLGFCVCRNHRRLGTFPKRPAKTQSGMEAEMWAIVGQSTVNQTRIRAEFCGFMSRVYTYRFGKRTFCMRIVFKCEFIILLLLHIFWKYRWLGLMDNRYYNKYNTNNPDLFLYD